MNKWIVTEGSGSKVWRLELRNYGGRVVCYHNNPAIFIVSFTTNLDPIGRKIGEYGRLGYAKMQLKDAIRRHLTEQINNLNNVDEEDNLLNPKVE